MKNTKIFNVISWSIGLIITQVLLFMIPSNPGRIQIVTSIFTILTFISQAVFWKKYNSSGTRCEKYYNMPILVISSIDILIQILLCLVAAWVGNVFTLKTIFLINLIVFAVYWEVIAVLLIGKEHIRKVDSRQREHHIEL